MKENFQRWQLIRINQLTYINNLVLGLAVGLLAYLFNFLQNPEINLNNIQKLFFWIGSILTIVSIFLALILALNRLEDFRITATITRNKNSNPTIYDERNESYKLGKKTWNLFTWQIATFLISFFAISLLLIIELWDKLT